MASTPSLKVCKVVGLPKAAEAVEGCRRLPESAKVGKKAEDLLKKRASQIKASRRVQEHHKRQRVDDRSRSQVNEVAR